MSSKIGLILSNLRAEGGPILASNLVHRWASLGVKPVIVVLNNNHLDLAPRFAKFGIEIESLDEPTIGLAAYPRLFTKMRILSRRHGLKALLSVPTGVHGVLFAGGRAGGVSRTVVHIGNYPWYWEGHFPRYRFLMRMAKNFTDHAVCVSEHVRQGVISHIGHCAQKSVPVICNGIDLQRFRPIENTQVGKFVVTVARLESGKDYRTLISAISVLKQRGYLCPLKIVGTGELRAELEKQVCELGLRSQVHFLGLRTDIPDLLSEARAFLFSVNSEEGLGIALVEAMACGLPCIASDVGACREVLDGGAAGLLVPPKDPVGLADAIERVLTDAGLAQKLGDAARCRAERVYSSEEMASRYLALLSLV